MQCHISAQHTALVHNTTHCTLLPSVLYLRCTHCHIVTLSHCTVTLSHCLIVTLSHCHIVTLSHCHIVTLSHCHIVTLSHCHIVTLSHFHIVTLSHCLCYSQFTSCSPADGRHPTSYMCILSLDSS